MRNGMSGQEPYMRVALTGKGVVYARRRVVSFGGAGRGKDGCPGGVWMLTMVWTRTTRTTRQRDGDTVMRWMTRGAAAPMRVRVPSADARMFVVWRLGSCIKLSVMWFCAPELWV